MCVFVLLQIWYKFLLIDLEIVTLKSMYFEKVPKVVFAMQPKLVPGWNYYSSKNFSKLFEKYFAYIGFYIYKGALKRT